MTTTNTNTNKLATRKQYLALFPGISEALAFESEVLSIGRDLLPPAAQAVLDDADPTPEYWAFLISQVAATKTYRIDHADDRGAEILNAREGRS